MTQRPEALPQDWRTIARVGEAEIERKRSIFYAYAAPVSTEAEALEILTERRELRPEAVHHVYAWRVGRRTEHFLQRMSDDGEPSGTGAMPMLQHIEGRELDDLIVVVSRIWGGTLLGTGGLARAYGDSAAAALETAGIVTMTWSRQYRITVDYDLYGALERLCSDENVAILEREFGAAVDIDVRLPLRDAADFLLAVTNLSAGRAVIQAGDSGWLAG
ncbi:MAG: YigZ family protein [Bacillota bacterium]|nr:YigZ family protein [Bacillota bacterium]